MSSPMCIEIHRPELEAMLREKMSGGDFDVEDLLEGALRVRSLMASLEIEIPRAPLLKVGAPASEMEEYAQQAAVIDFAVALKKGGFEIQRGAIAVMLTMALVKADLYAAAAQIADRFFGISIHPNTLRNYWKLMKSTNHDAQISAFLKRASEDPSTRLKLVGAARNYDEVARIAAAQGLTKSAAELEKYFASWRFLSSMMKGLRDRGAITEEQFRERAGFPSADYGMAGFGPGVDLSIMGGVLSATGWAGKLVGMSSAKVPMAAIIFPTTVVIVGGLEGRTFNFKQLGDMFAQSFLLALEGMVESLEHFRESMGRIFG